MMILKTTSLMEGHKTNKIVTSIITMISNARSYSFVTFVSLKIMWLLNSQLAYD
jgi:hypothetical protein